MLLAQGKMQWPLEIGILINTWMKLNLTDNQKYQLSNNDKLFITW